MLRYSKTLLVFFILFAVIIFSQVSAQNESRQIIWTPIPEAPQPFSKAVGGVIGNYFYVFGGQPHTRMAFAYSIADNSWLQSTPSEYPLLESAYCVTDEAIYRFAGIGSKNIAEKFTPGDSGTGAWTPVTPPPSEFRRPGASCCWDGGNFIYANNCDKSNNPDGYFARYSVSGDSWEPLPAAPHPRRYAGMASVDNLIYLVGGIGSNQRDPRACQVFDPSDSSWALIAPHPDRLNYTSSTVITDGTHIWTIGHGAGYGNFPASSNVHYYDPSSDTWNEETDLPVTRGWSLTGFQASTSRIIQAGGNEGNGMKFVADGINGQVATAHPGLLNGTVIDDFYSNPVPDVEVSVYNQDSIFVSKDTTDVHGYYALFLTPATYYAVYSKDSYLDSTISDIQITSNDTTTVDITLTFQHQCDYYPGDVNGSWNYNGLDVTYLIAYLFHGGPAPMYECECTPGDIWYVSCDTDSSCTCDEDDLPPLINILKTGIARFPFPCPDCPPVEYNKGQ